MKKSRFSEEKIIVVLKQAEAGLKLAKLPRRLAYGRARTQNARLIPGEIVTRFSRDSHNSF